MCHLLGGPEKNENTQVFILNHGLLNRVTKFPKYM